MANNVRGPTNQGNQEFSLSKLGPALTLGKTAYGMGRLQLGTVIGIKSDSLNFISRWFKTLYTHKEVSVSGVKYLVNIEKFRAGLSSLAGNISRELAVQLLTNAELTAGKNVIRTLEAIQKNVSQVIDDTTAVLMSKNPSNKEFRNYMAIKANPGFREEQVRNFIFSSNLQEKMVQVVRSFSNSAIEDAFISFVKSDLLNYKGTNYSGRLEFLLAPRQVAAFREVYAERVGGRAIREEITRLPVFHIAREVERASPRGSPVVSASSSPRASESEPMSPQVLSPAASLDSDSASVFSSALELPSAPSSPAPSVPPSPSAAAIELPVPSSEPELVISAASSVPTPEVQSFARQETEKLFKEYTKLESIIDKEKLIAEIESIETTKQKPLISMINKVVSESSEGMWGILVKGVLKNFGIRL